MSIKGDHSSRKKGDNGYVDLKAKGKVSAPKLGSNSAGSGNNTKLQRITSK